MNVRFILSQIFTRIATGEEEAVVVRRALYEKVAELFASADISTDRGDANVTLSVAEDQKVQRFATNLTANRTVTLSETGANSGDYFRIVRTGLGAFTLDVGGLKTIPNSTAAFVEVMFDGADWVLIGYGAL